MTTTYPIRTAVNVSPREVWPNEAQDFTPWLLANPDYLADALNYELQITDREVPVDRYSCDLVGHDLTNNAPLYIENQLEGSDHSHLGQVLTYLAGLIPDDAESATVVWIASNFTDGHRKAIRFLNRSTDHRFFAVSLSVILVGGEAVCPTMSVDVAPDDWQDRRSDRRFRSEPGENSIRRVYDDFWKEYMESTAMPLDFQTGDYSWQRTDRLFGRSRLIAVWRNGTIEMEMFIQRYQVDGDSGYHVEWMDRVEEQRDLLEAALGAPLVRSDAQSASKIVMRLDGCALEGDRTSTFAALDEARNRIKTVFMPVLEAAA